MGNYGELVRELRGEFCICILSKIEPKVLGSGEEANKSKGGFDNLDCGLPQWAVWIGQEEHQQMYCHMN